VWGANPIPKLDRSVEAAEQLGAQTVVVHPPFRWQRRYADGFTEQVAELEASSDVMVAVENMFPFRADRLFRAGQSIERMRRRGGGPGPAFSAFAPSHDPLDGDHAHYTLDLSHSATAGTDAERAREVERAARPQGRLFFAGEHCSLSPAWVNAGIESALDAVAQIDTFARRLVSDRSHVEESV
ncbi:MAG: sugar phosphate isomerase/epimerase, partial [Pseudonocardiaceae bacterium]